MRSRSGARKKQRRDSSSASESSAWSSDSSSGSSSASSTSSESEPRSNAERRRRRPKEARSSEHRRKHLSRTAGGEKRKRRLRRKQTEARRKEKSRKDAHDVQSARPSSRKRRRRNRSTSSDSSSSCSSSSESSSGSTSASNTRHKDTKYVRPDRHRRRCLTGNGGDLGEGIQNRDSDGPLRLHQERAMSSFLPEESDKHYEMSSSGAQNQPLDLLDPGQTVRPKLVSPVESLVGLADLETNVKISQEPPLSASLGHEQNGYDLVDVVEPGSDVFVWRKREKALAKHGPDGQQLGSAANDASRYELLREFEEAKHARERRELERAEKKREQMQQNRLEEQERNKEWEEQEEAFHAKQFFDRQKIRIQERRATLADVIANNLRLLESPLEIRYESKSVRDHLRASTFVELQTLVPEIKRALYYSVRAPVIDSGEVPRDFFISRDERVQFWKDIEVMVVAELKVKDSNASPEAHTAQLEEKPSTGPSDLPLYGFEPDICRAVATACEDSNGETLRAYVCELIGRGKIPNPAFWEHVLEQIDVAAAQSRINSLYERVRVEYQRIMDAIPASEKMASNAAKQEQLTTPYDESAELANLLREEREKGMEQDEEMYANEAAVERVWRSWHDKHTPRKPRYFNRVHLGYDWNKYNQMHYDKTNPPPKTVKGYKFNIFYPDLLDKGQTPTFQIHDTDHPDISIITFYAGAPYEPVAFKIARRPWEYSHKRGYKCTFERGVLRLWFSFQRMRYRR